MVPTHPNSNTSRGFRLKSYRTYSGSTVNIQDINLSLGCIFPYKIYCHSLRLICDVIKYITQKPNISITVAYGVSIRINLCGIWTPFPLEEYIPKTLEPAYLTVTAGRFDRYLLWEMATFFIRKPYASSTPPQ